MPAGLIVTDPVVSRYARFESDVDLSVSWNYINELFTSTYEARLVNGVGETLYHFVSINEYSSLLIPSFSLLLLNHSLMERLQLTLEPQPMNWFIYK